MKEEFNLVILSLGSNLGEPEEQIKAAYLLIELRIGEILKKSDFYYSEPWGFEADSNFINSAIYVKTNLRKEDLLNCCQQIEKDLGRQPKTSSIYESRPIDIDIIDYDGEVISSEQLNLPHALMHLRLFVLEPVAQILPDWRHPISNKNCHEMMAEIINGEEQ